MNNTKCPTCNAPAKMTWSGLDLVAESGDETLASKHYEFEPTALNTDIMQGWPDCQTAQKLLAIRDELAKGNIDEAYHQLCLIADPKLENLNHWQKLETIAQGQPAVGKARGPQSQSEGFYCSEWDKCGYTCEEQCPKCEKADRAELL